LYAKERGVALLEDGNTCCICDEKSINRSIGGVPAYYCASCFEAHKSDILGSRPWVKMLMNAERQRRKRRNRLLTGGYVLAAVYGEGTGIAPRTRTRQQMQYV
jgi:hypothetical protein